MPRAFYPEEDPRPAPVGPGVATGEDIAGLARQVADLHRDVAAMRDVSRLAFRLDILRLYLQTGRAPMYRLATSLGSAMTTSYTSLWTNDRRRLVCFRLVLAWSTGTTGARVRVASPTGADTDMADDIVNPGTGASGATYCLLRPGQSVFVRDGQGSGTPGAADILHPGFDDVDDFLLDAQWASGLASVRR